MTPQNVEPEIYDLMYRLGITPTYTGFFQASYAVHLAMQQPRRLLLVTKWIYPEVAQAFNTNWRAVERNIRSISIIMWKRSQPVLEELAGKPLTKKPPAGQLLAFMAHNVQQTISGASEANGKSE